MDSLLYRHTSASSALNPSTSNDIKFFNINTRQDALAAWNTPANPLGYSTGQFTNYPH
ncbi:hypothetical protein RI543_004140 [Arxiozyma heterogenica]|uniref:Uncharacterized protein n=1 Tax=Arxiozyma heterogenica TaxID=278026 RepID=A0AAN7VZZ2_9SACH|nr:hypothetical protein RI543_004140 [Kazachstania heterogenica]